MRHDILLDIQFITKKYWGDTQILWASWGSIKGSSYIFLFGAKENMLFCTLFLLFIWRHNCKDTFTAIKCFIGLGPELKIIFYVWLSLVTIWKLKNHLSRCNWHKWVLKNLNMFLVFLSLLFSDKIGREFHIT